MYRKHPTIKKFKGEPFQFFGVAKSLPELRSAEFKARKDGFLFRFLWDKNCWKMWRKEKSRIRNVKM